MSVERLRALALANAPTADYPICLDRAKKVAVDEAMTALGAAVEAAEAASDEDDRAGSLSDAPVSERRAAAVEEARAALSAAIEAARPDSVVAIFRRLPASADSAADGTDWESLVRRHTTDGRLDTTAVSAELPGLCYLRTETPEGDDMGWGWAEAAAQLDPADLRSVRNMLWGHHNVGAFIPFDPRTSGQPETT